MEKTDDDVEYCDAVFSTSFLQFLQNAPTNVCLFLNLGFNVASVASSWWWWEEGEGGGIENREEKPRELNTRGNEN